MKPQDLYRGQAPAAMGMMGQGLAEVGSNIARTTLAGYQALGEGIASGVKQAANAYQEKKKLDAQNKADEGFVKTMLPYMPESIRNDFAARHESLMSDPSASALDKAAFYHSAKSYLGQSIAHTMDMEKIAQSAAYNPSAITAPAAAEASSAQAALDAERLKQLQGAPAAQAEKSKMLREGLADFRSMFGAPTPPVQSPTNIGGVSVTQPAVQSSTLYDNLSPEVQAMVESSGIGKDAWNSMDESNREANLANVHLPNFGLPARKKK